MQKKENEEKEKKNWFVRILIIILSAVILSMVVMSFFLNEPKYVFNYGILVALLIVVFLITAELFDNFSIGKIFSAKKEIDKKDKEIDKISTENKELRNQITNIFVASNQNTNKNEFKILFSEMKVEKATEADKSKNKEIEYLTKEEPREDSVPLSRMMPEIEKLLLNKYFGENNIGSNEVTKGVRFVGEDPIMDKPYVFDAYYATNELFIEITRSSLFFLDRLYHAISKLYHYRIAKNNSAKMILLIPLLPDKNKYRDYSSKICEIFSPAIKNKLLDIKFYEVTENEFEEIKEKSKAIYND